MKKKPVIEYYTMHDIPEFDRPRERLQKLGSEYLSIQELLAVIMGRGVPGDPVMKIAQGLHDRFIDIRGLADASVEELSEVRGVGFAKACQIRAAFELANRLSLSSSSSVKLYIRTPDDAYQELKGKARGEQKEHFWAILLDTRNKVIKTTEISSGSLDTSIVHPRELFKEAIKASAASMIIAHNHPSGNPDASQDDIKLSKRLKEAGELVGIEIVDHIILGDGRYISLKREGLI